MLPAHLRTTTTTTRQSSRDNAHDTMGGGRLRQPPPPPPSLCVTGAMCQQGNCRIVRPTMNQSDDNTSTPDTNSKQNDHHLNQTATISYRIFRPRQLLRKPPPLVVVHGGPSIPSTYLLPLVNTICDRSIVLYDQWGCGKSSRPTPTTTTSSSPSHHAFPPLDISILVDDLHHLITNEWKLQSFHLYGHSFGGMLCFEYLQRYQPAHCLSLILASTPTSTALVESEMARLKKELFSNTTEKTTTKETNGQSNDNDNNDYEAGDDNDDDDDDDDDDDYRYQLKNTNQHPSSLLSSLSDPLGRGSGSSGMGMTGTSSRQSPSRLSHRQHRQETLFFETHHCRVSNPVPLVLQDALASAGPIPWRGLAAIPNYQATTTVVDAKSAADTTTTSSSSSSSRSNTNEERDLNNAPTENNESSNSRTPGFPPTLLMHGEHDFVTRVCMESWYDLLQPHSLGDGSSIHDADAWGSVVQDMVMVPNCSHYGMLEDEHAYGTILCDFFLKHDS